jgi:hypothetical protein
MDTRGLRALSLRILDFAIAGLDWTQKPRSGLDRACTGSLGQYEGTIVAQCSDVSHFGHGEKASDTAD